MMLEQLIGMFGGISATMCVNCSASITLCVCFLKSADTISGTPQKLRLAENATVPTMLLILKCSLKISQMLLQDAGKDTVKFECTIKSIADIEFRFH